MLLLLLMMMTMTMMMMVTNLQVIKQTFHHSKVMQIGASAILVYIINTVWMLRQPHSVSSTTASI